MPKPKITVQEAASTITGEILRSAAWASKHISELLVPRESFLKRVFSSQHRNAERFEVLKLNCDIVLPHLAVTEYNLEHGDYWEDRSNSDIVDLIRRLSFQAIGQAFENAGCGTIDANSFVNEKTERLAVYAAISLVENIAKEVEKDHELPSTMSVAELVAYLGPSRISNYKEVWTQDNERILQAPPNASGFIAALPQKVYEHWRGQAPRNWDVVQI